MGITAFTYDSGNAIKGGSVALNANIGGSTAVGIEGGVPKAKGKLEGSLDREVKGGLEWDKQINIPKQRKPK